MDSFEKIFDVKSQPAVCVLYEVFSINRATPCRKFRKAFCTFSELEKFYNELRLRKSVCAIYDIRCRKVLSNFKFIDTEISF